MDRHQKRYVDILFVVTKPNLKILGCIIDQDYPFGQLPLLEHNGKKVCQSVAICRYLARELNLAGSSNWEGVEIDAIVDSIVDLKQSECFLILSFWGSLDFFFASAEISVLFFEKDETAKEEKATTLINETVPYYFTRFDKIAEENNGHLALGRVTYQFS